MEPTKSLASEPSGDGAFVAPSTLTVEDLASLPARMGTEDMIRVFGIKHRNHFYHLVAAGRFDAFELKPRIGRRQWSGAKVAAYLSGEKVSR